MDEHDTLCQMFFEFVVIHWVAWVASSQGISLVDSFFDTSKIMFPSVFRWWTQPQTTTVLHLGCVWAHHTVERARQYSPHFPSFQICNQAQNYGKMTLVRYLKSSWKGKPREIWTMEIVEFGLWRLWREVAALEAEIPQKFHHGEQSFVD